MQYVVQTVEQGELPDGVDLVIVDRGDDDPVMLLSGKPAEAWTAWRQWEDTIEPRMLPSLLYAV